ncbi:hypothetical protein HanRHA438_Chr11g0502921 [Helianthus annuus]|nr:hypothetical protein HanIR_Chr11g0527611 [Helianthus annuus]KAJ0870656.1 hypothetical protein HanRHA438_Chr11g0502921 [Helianthus annuus]
MSLGMAIIKSDFALSSPATRSLSSALQFISLLGAFLSDQSQRFRHRTNIKSIIPGLKVGHI